MCHQYEPLPRSVMEDIAQAIATGTLGVADYAVDQIEDDTQSSVFPGDQAHIILAGGTILTCTWGFTVAWQKQLVYNTRIETALDANSFWGDALENRRCLVPVRAFFETHRTETVRSQATGKRIKKRYRFCKEDGAPLFLAGIYGADCFSLVTTEPDSCVGAVHDRMPLTLNETDAVSWLGSDYAKCLVGVRPTLISCAMNPPANSAQLSLF